LFNAAFFAGLDIPEYKAHSVYISRYPFGREATLAYPGVDLKIKNNTPYAVVIWPTYTDTSITVQLYSTRFAKGEQESVTPPKGCGRITLVRKRTFVDGRTDSQKYYANYNCNPPSH
jgi:vancomycin resistance protein YoaR